MYDGKTKNLTMLISMSFKKAHEKLEKYFGTFGSST